MAVYPDELNSGFVALFVSVERVLRDNARSVRSAVGLGFEGY